MTIQEPIEKEKPTMEAYVARNRRIVIVCSTPPKWDIHYKIWEGQGFVAPANRFPEIKEGECQKVRLTFELL